MHRLEELTQCCELRAWLHTSQQSRSIALFGHLSGWEVVGTGFLRLCAALPVFKDAAPSVCALCLLRASRERDGLWLLRQLSCTERLRLCPPVWMSWSVSLCVVPQGLMLRLLVPMKLVLGHLPGRRAAACCLCRRCRSHGWDVFQASRAGKNQFPCENQSRRGLLDCLLVFFLLVFFLWVKGDPSSLASY